MAIAGGAQLHAVGARAVGERVQALVQVRRPAAQPVGAVEVGRRHLGHVDELLEQPVIVAP
jgi:hypothetical protein